MAVLLPLLAVDNLLGFPIEKIGPIAAVLFVQLATLAWIFGLGNSLVATHLIEAPPQAAPPLVEVSLAVLCVVLLFVAVRRLRARARDPVPA